MNNPNARRRKDAQTSGGDYTSPPDTSADNDAETGSENGVVAGAALENFEEKAAKKPAKLKNIVFFGSAISIVAIALWTIIGTESAESVLGTMTVWIGKWFGWFYIGLATVIFIFVLFIGFSRYGKVRLGPANSRPEYSNFAWASMLFAAGIGTDIMFFSVAEPVTQYMYPPVGEGQTIEAAREATVWTIFHYGLTGWGMYALMGMALGYFAYRHKHRLAVRSALYPVFGKRVNGVLGDVVDSAAILGTVFGVATTLGIGVVQINVGLDILFGVQQGLPAQIALIVLAIVMASVSATTGVSKGIRVLSQLNVALAVSLAGWVLVTGKTDFLLNALIMNIGDTLSGFPGMTADTMAFSGVSEWMNGWTLFFWAWWIAWASFVGMFLARISRGRTLRQFVVGTLTIPFMYVVMWISIFGNAALNRVIENNDIEWAELTVEVPELGFYSLIQDYPLGTVLVAVATFVALLFYVTSADSGALVMANLSTELPTPRTDAPAHLRIFWATVTGVLTIGVLMVGGIPALQQATVVMGLPFAFVMVLVMFGLYTALRIDAKRHASREFSTRNVVAGAGVHAPGGEEASWKDRLTHAFGHVQPRQAKNYMDRVAQPALEDLAAEIARKGDFSVRVVRGDEDILEVVSSDTVIYDRLKLEALRGDDHFIYRILAVDAPTAVYGGRIQHESDRSTRLEIYATSGGGGYDVMGYSGGDIIHDCLDHFARHQEYLRAQDEASSAI